VNSDNRRAQLLRQVVASWEKLDGLSVEENLGEHASAFSTGEKNKFGATVWRPILQTTGATMLDPLYAKLPARFPPLYEELLLTYRWAEVDLGSYRLFGNPLGTDLLGLLHGISKDKFLSTCLPKNGYIPFGKGPDIDYDPVCFDLSHGKRIENLRSSSSTTKKFFATSERGS
jgi:hypothetical protein